MDSQWFDQQMNDQCLPNNIVGDTIDLTLKLGLPNKSNNSEKNKKSKSNLILLLWLQILPLKSPQIQFDFAPLAPNLTTQPIQIQFDFVP